MFKVCEFQITAQYSCKWLFHVGNFYIHQNNFWPMKGKRKGYMEHWKDASVSWSFIKRSHQSNEPIETTFSFEVLGYSPTLIQRPKKASAWSLLSTKLGDCLHRTDMLQAFVLRHCDSFWVKARTQVELLWWSGALRQSRNVCHRSGEKKERMISHEAQLSPKFYKDKTNVHLYVADSHFLHFKI